MGVPAGHPAAAAGVRVGDVLQAVDNVPVRAIENVGARIGFRPPGTSVELLLWRWDSEAGSARRIVLPVKLGQLDPEVLYPRVSQLLQRAGMGEIASLTPRIAHEKEVVWSPGVIIISAAQGSDFEPLSIIKAVNGEAVSSVEDLYARIQSTINRSVPISPDGGDRP